MICKWLGRFYTDNKGKIIGFIPMADVVKFYATGGPEVLKLDHFEVPAPGPNQVKLKHHAIGLTSLTPIFGMVPTPFRFPADWA